MQNVELKRIISFGKKALSNSGRKLNEVEVVLHLRTRDDGRLEFSAHGVVWNARHTDCILCGQCLDYIQEHCSLKYNKFYNEIVGLWKRNHLNGMHSGTERQEQELERAFGNGEYDYQMACEALKKAGVYDDNGYVYGSGWVYREINEADLKRIVEIINTGK